VKFEDLTGKKFGMLTVLRRVPGLARPNDTRWLCKCDCSKEFEIYTHQLKTRRNLSCGCTKTTDLIGQRFGRLTVVEKMEPIVYQYKKKRSSKIRYRCKCDCGNEIITISDSLRQGRTISCKCILKGETSPKYNPNITQEERERGRKYPEYAEWRTTVYEQDEYTCYVCGSSKSNTLNAHHIMSYTTYPEWRTLSCNGVTLCKTCHKEFHSIYGTKGAVAINFIKFLNSKGIN